MRGRLALLVGLGLGALSSQGQADDFQVSYKAGAAGVPLPRKLVLLIASNWDLTGTAGVLRRDGATGAWSATTLAEGSPAPDFLPQIRSFAGHRARITGIDLVFAGHTPRGIYS